MDQDLLCSELFASELFGHSERTRAATQGVYMPNLCNILCYFMSVEIYYYVFHAVRETAHYNVSV